MKALRIFLLVVLPFVCGGYSSLLQSQEEEQEINTEPADNEGADLENNDTSGFPLIAQEIADYDRFDLPEETKSTQSDICNPAFIVPFLNNAGIITIIRQPLYLKSTTPLNRNLHDLPTFNWVPDLPGLDIAVLPFYNQTSKVFFTDSDPFIRSYLNLRGEPLLDAIEDIFKLLAIEINPREIFSLFEKTKLQERRAAVFLRACSTYNDFTIQISAPILFVERNLFLTPQEREAIAFSPAIQELAPSSSQDEAEQLFIEHLVSDKVGLGDMRIYGLYTPYLTACSKLRLGAFITLPTAFAVQQGIIGGAFCRDNCHPAINFETLICPSIPGVGTISTQARARQRLQKIGFAVLDHLTANIADISLGNNGHVTIAPILQHGYRWNDCLEVITQASFQYVFPASEKRFFIHKTDQAAFDRRDFASTDPEVAASNLRFLERTLTNSLFPRVLRVSVQPGAIANVNTALVGAYSCLYGSLGYDFWWQGQESFSFDRPPPADLLIGKARNRSGLQHKIFGSVGTSITTDSTTLLIGLRGDLTVASAGLGKDFTVALNFQFLF